MACRGSGVRVPVAPPSTVTADLPPLARPAGGAWYPRATVTDTADDRTRIERYDPTAIEPRWQARWAKLDLYETDLRDTSKPKYYLLTMYPYPSGDLHIGHWYIVTPSDALARFRRMHGYNVFFPIGFDAFGLPAENAAIKSGGHPFAWTMANIENMRRQFRTMGATFAWDAEVVTADPEYYRWNQWLFLQFLEQGLAYRAEVAGGLVPQRRDPGARAGRRRRSALLAVRRAGREARPGAVVPAHDRLRRRAARLHRPRLARADQTMQTNWIGRSEGAEIDFEIAAGRAPAGRRHPARLHDPARTRCSGRPSWSWRPSTRWSRR